MSKSLIQIQILPPEHTGSVMLSLSDGEYTQKIAVSEAMPISTAIKVCIERFVTEKARAEAAVWLNH